MKRPYGMGSAIAGMLGLGLLAGCFEPTHLEVCDGRDNDKNGDVDEGFRVGDACQVGAHTGTLVCDTPFTTRCEAPDAGVQDAGCPGADAGCDSATDPSLDPCQEEPIPFLEEPEAEDNLVTPSTCDHARCRHTLDGTVAMTYCLPAASTDAGVSAPYAMCTLARTDMRRFDAHWTSEGLDLEIGFCVEAPGVSGELTLYYGQHPFRRFLTLVRPDEFATRGCYVRQFSAAQVQTPGFAEIEKPCHFECGDEGGEACKLDLVDATGSPELAPITLVAERAPGPASGTILVQSLRFVPRECRCRSDADCKHPARPVCRDLAPTPACPAAANARACAPRE